LLLTAGALLQGQQPAGGTTIKMKLLLPVGETVEVRAGFPPEDMLDDADLAAAKWTWQHAQAAGRGADTLPGAKRLFLPMKTGRGTVGVIGVDRDAPGPLLSPDQRRLLDALSDQAASRRSSRPTKQLFVSACGA
jgi:two-component system sensor histidine kinase KdpD